MYKVQIMAGKAGQPARGGLSSGDVLWMPFPKSSGGSGTPPYVSGLLQLNATMQHVHRVNPYHARVRALVGQQDLNRNLHSPRQPDRLRSGLSDHDCFTVTAQLGIAADDFDCHLQRHAATAAGVSWHTRKDTRAPAILRTE